VQRGFEQGGSKSKACGRKQSGGLFSPTWVTSRKSGEATGTTVPEKSPSLRQKKAPTNRLVLLLFCAKGIRTRREQVEGLRKKTVRWTVFADVGNEPQKRRGDRHDSAGKIPFSPPEKSTNQSVGALVYSLSRSECSEESF